MVVSIEVDGRRFEETKGFLSVLAIARARNELPQMRKRTEQNLLAEMGGMLVCTVARALASSLLYVNQFPYGGGGNAAAAHEVDGDQGMRGWLQGETACNCHCNVVTLHFYFIRLKKRYGGGMPQGHANTQTTCSQENIV